MKYLNTITVFFLGLTNAIPAREIETRASLQGLDVSAYQANVNWHSVVAKGASFAIIKVVLLCLSHTSTNLLSGNRRHFIQESNIFIPVYRLLPGWFDTRSISLCQSTQFLWRCTGQLFSCSWGWMVRRWQNFAGNVRLGIWHQFCLLGALALRHGQLDYRFCAGLPLQDKTLPYHLY